MFWVTNAPTVVVISLLQVHLNQYALPVHKLVLTSSPLEAIGPIGRLKSLNEIWPLALKASAQPPLF